MPVALLTLPPVWDSHFVLSSGMYSFIDLALKNETSIAAVDYQKEQSWLQLFFEGKLIAAGSISSNRLPLAYLMISKNNGSQHKTVRKNHFAHLCPAVVWSPSFCDVRRLKRSFVIYDPLYLRGKKNQRKPQYAWLPKEKNENVTKQARMEKKFLGREKKKNHKYWQAL